MLDFGHELNIPFGTALGQRAHEEAKEQDRTLDNDHKANALSYGVKFGRCFCFMARLVPEHEDYEGGRAVE